MAEQYAYLRARLSRRRVLVTAGAVAGGALAGCSGTVSSDPVPKASPSVHGSVVAPFGRHLAFGSDPRTRMRISWQVPLAVHRPFVRIGVRPDELSHRIEAEVRALHTPGVPGERVAVDQYYVHAALDGLTPGTTYHYGVGHDGFDPAAADRRATLGTFRTAPARPEAFTFTAFGDQGVGEHAALNDRLLLRRNPAFHLHAGDLCYADTTGHGKETDLYDPRLWDTFLAQTESVAKSVPWMVTSGNHDMEAWYSPTATAARRRAGRCRTAASTRAGRPGCTRSCTATWASSRWTPTTCRTRSRPTSATRRADRPGGWSAALGELRANPAVDFVVVFFHHCAYSTSTHASDGGVRAAWLPLFTRHRVDLVINGHNHVYERTDAIRDGEVGRVVPVGGDTDPTRDGIVYVTAGGGGKDLYSFPTGVPDSYENAVADREAVRTFHWTRARERHADTVEWSRVRYTGFSFLSVRADPGPRPRLTVSALAQNGRRIDHFTVRRGGG